MKRRSDWLLLNGSYSLCRVVLKVNNCYKLLQSNEKEVYYYFIENCIFPYKTLQKKTQKIRINKLFTTLYPGQIIRLVNKAMKLDPNYQAPDFLSYYAFECTGEVDCRAVLKNVERSDCVEQAYIESDLRGPSPVIAGHGLTKLQGYLNAGPMGINAHYAWKQKGGVGNGNVKFIDIEQGWLLHHENVILSKFSNTGINHDDYKDHGVAVCGIILMQGKRNGGTGITPKVHGAIISQWRPDGLFNTADAIMSAISHLQFGDIILIEAQVSNSLKDDRVWPVEVHEANFQAIRLATALGIIVIEAAGNGNFSYLSGNDLDCFIHKGKKILDPSTPGFRDSGAIIVAAASSSVPHERIGYSNYGDRINCYAWGENVVTAGNFPESSGAATNSYIYDFGGTSSASAIITGTAIAVQSIVEANFRSRLSPAKMRAILSNEEYGTASANGHSIDKIGVMPDLKKIINNVQNDPSNKFKESTHKG